MDWKNVNQKLKISKFLSNQIYSKVIFESIKGRDEILQEDIQAWMGWWYT